MPKICLFLFSSTSFLSLLLFHVCLFCLHFPFYSPPYSFLYFVLKMSPFPFFCLHSIFLYFLFLFHSPIYTFPFPSPLSFYSYFSMWLATFPEFSYCSMCMAEWTFGVLFPCFCFHPTSFHFLHFRSFLYHASLFCYHFSCFLSFLNGTVVFAFHILFRSLF